MPESVEQPPTAEELVGPGLHGLDETRVLRNFLGKTQGEAREMLQDRPSVYEDFTYMTPAGLCYYLPAALDYLNGEESRGDWEFAHGLMCALSTQVAIFGKRGEALARIKQIAEYCHKERTKFDIGQDALFDSYLAAIWNCPPAEER